MDFKNANIMNIKRIIREELAKYLNRKNETPFADSENVQLEKLLDGGMILGVEWFFWFLFKFFELSLYLY